MNVMIVAGSGRAPPRNARSPLQDLVRPPPLSDFLAQPPATGIRAVEQRIASVDDLIAEPLEQRPLAPVIGGLPGIRPLLPAEPLVRAAGMNECDRSAKLAAHAEW